MTSIGFIGLGNMGLPMVERLLECGQSVRVFDVDVERMRTAESSGAKGAGNPGEAAEGADIVFSMLPEDEHVLDVVRGEQGVLGRLQNGQIYVDLSTISPETMKAVASEVEGRGAACLGAAVGPGPAEAREGTLSVMVAGLEHVVEEAFSTLSHLGTPIYCGPLGAAKAAKLANNLVTGTTLVMMTEAMLLAKSAGLDLETFVSILGETGARNFIGTELFPRKVFRGDYEPGFKLSLVHKDVRLAVALAKSYGLSLGLGEESLKELQRGLSKGMGEKDLTIYATVREEETGVSLRTPGPPVESATP